MPNTLVRRDKKAMKRFKKGTNFLYYSSPSGRIHWFNIQHEEEYRKHRLNMPSIAWPHVSEQSAYTSASSFYEGFDIVPKKPIMDYAEAEKKVVSNMVSEGNL